MLSRYKDYVHAVVRRVLVVLIVLVFGFVIHRFSLGVHRQIFGAMIFIILFSSGLLYYYISMFKAKAMHPREFLVSLLSVFILTVTMFAIIYNEPIDDSQSSFIENGVMKNDLSLSSSIYFSTVTITTLGYGDIAPVGSYRYFAMAEVLLGLIYVGVIVYFVTRVFE